jgi:putative flippase GtrA
LAFFWGSAAGLMIDLSGFQLLVWLGLEPWLANGMSSAGSITAVYFLVSRYSFKGSVGLRTYVMFVTWYGLSIVIFSTLIQYASSETGWVPIVWKLLSVPVSFSLNYAFSRRLFRRRGDAPHSGDGEEW